MPRPASLALADRAPERERQQHDQGDGYQPPGGDLGGVAQPVGEPRARPPRRPRPASRRRSRSRRRMRRTRAACRSMAAHLAPWRSHPALAYRRPLPTRCAAGPPPGRARSRRSPGRSTSSAASDPGQCAPAPSAPQNVPNAVSMIPTTNFSVFSGTRASGALIAKPANADDEHRRHGRDRRERDVLGVAAERQRDEDHLEAFEQHALERERERVGVGHQAESPGRGRFRRRQLLAVDRVLVVQVLVPAGPQDRLAQPLQAEDQQQRADEQPQSRTAAAWSRPARARP